MGTVVQLHAERWVEIFDEADFLVEVSTSGQVRFTNGVESRTLTMKQVFQLGQALSAAFGSDGKEPEGRPDDVESDQAE